MDQGLARELLDLAYILDAPELNRVATNYGTSSWSDLINDPVFVRMGTGGGCMALAAQTSAGPWLSLTDGEAGLPVTVDTFCLSVEHTLMESEDYVLLVRGGEVISRSGPSSGIPERSSREQP